MTSVQTTLVALSSGMLPSGVAVIRISGDRSRFVIETIAGKVPKPRVASLRSLRAPGSGELLDYGLVIFFPAPASFTGEDVAEFHCHGGQAVVEAVLQAVCGLNGVEMARPGDFTRQAYTNGKLDLTQVEALGDLIAASSQEQRKQALVQFGGAASEKLKGWSEQLLWARAAIEAELDFSDEADVAALWCDGVVGSLKLVVEAMQIDLADTFGERLRSGFHVVLAGAPNSGKSTLLNALLQRDAALVSDIAGTTRDRIDAWIDWDGLPVILSDTAGLRSVEGSTDVLEVLGMERSRSAMNDADLVLWLDDGSRAQETCPALTKMIRVRSKSDLRADGGEQYIDNDGLVVAVSGLTGDGLDQLKAWTSVRLRQLGSSTTSGPGGQIALDARRRQALQSAFDHCCTALGGLESSGDGCGLGLELVAEELGLAQRALGRIVGEIDSEALLDVVFARFCIGK
jgi:tRNA modification GTPase